MRVKKVRINNFRSYEHDCIIDINDLNTIVGKNDIGKSTILEALDIFFNKGKGAIRLDKDDINKDCLQSGNSLVEIVVHFDEFPSSLVLDSSNRTSLEKEYLLNADNELEVVKRYPNAGSEKVFIKAHHPTNEGCNDLLLRKQSDLKKLISSLQIECDDKTRNAVMRSAIWSHYSDNLELAEQEIDVTKGDTKSIWDKLEGHLPLYSLFQSDRKNSDGDSEVQDPLNEAVKQIMNDHEIQMSLLTIAETVERKLTEVAGLTLEKLREMNPDIANSLNPIIPPSDSLKWTDVFKKVSISGDQNIPVNKRGSGVKRLILLNFFRAEAERRKKAKNIPSIIYAIEEPETSQHTNHQKQLIRSLIDLSKAENTQILLTTHSSVVVKELDFEHLRIVSVCEDKKTVDAVLPSKLPYPSLNEVNYAAFGEVTEEYHNELYGYIEGEGMLNQFKKGRETLSYVRLKKDGSTLEEKRILTEYIRHQIHHPENPHNPRYTSSQLNDSIRQMREFIEHSQN